ncbi:MAG: phosphatidate cytidylyltransferase [Planctomycetes bacterium]|nr:phosphatidate cytidylyltransferase [Planctomycetota bacterium]
MLLLETIELRLASLFSWAPRVEWLNTRTIIVMFSVLGLLAASFVVGRVLRRQSTVVIDSAMVRAFNRRVGAWLMMCAILALAIILGRVVTVVMFGLVSFWALREFVTMTPTRRGDHRALFWTFFIFTPLQYVFVGIGHSNPKLDFYGIYSIMIPVYVSLFIPARIAISGDPKRFLERSAKIQAGLLICVYAFSYAPAILDLQLWERTTGEWQLWSNRSGKNAGLLFYFVLIVQLGDVFQFIWDRVIGKHVIAPAINSRKTWEGLLGCAISTSAVGILLNFTGVTPFTWYGAGLMALVVALMGFAGTMTMSAIKRDRGVTDYGTLVQGHAGVLDRIDSMCFAAPVFFHITRYFLHVLPKADGMV